jgi:hypothetical protein
MDTVPTGAALLLAFIYRTETRFQARGSLVARLDQLSEDKRNMTYGLTLLQLPDILPE